MAVQECHEEDKDIVGGFMTLFGFLPRDYAEKISKIMIIDQIYFRQIWLRDCVSCRAYILREGGR